MKSKSILKVIATGLFVFAMAFGAATSMTVSDSGINVNLRSLSGQVAQGEALGSGCWFDYTDCCVGGGWNQCGICAGC